MIKAEKDRDIVVVHAGMEMDPSLVTFQERFADRFFNVGMAEQLAVTFSAGLSSGGLHTFFFLLQNKAFFFKEKFVCKILFAYI